MADRGQRLERWRGAAAGWLRTPWAPILGGYVLLRLGGFVGVEPVAYRDTAGYLEVASHPLWSLDFLAGGRAWAVPLVYKLAPDAEQARAWAQLSISIVCWSLLAAALARCLRAPAVRYAGFAAVLAFSLSLAVIRWDVVMLSESVSISLTALTLAAWLEMLRAPRPRMAVALLAVTLVWVFARDSNGVIALCTVPLAAYWVWRPAEGLSRAWAAGLAGGIAAIFLLGLAATTTEDAQLRRNERPILHVVGRRVLANPAQTRWFLDHGMPTPPPRVVANRRSLAGIAEGTIPSDPETEAFLEWAREDGRSTLARYLLAHPGGTLKAAFANRQRLLGGVTVGYTSPNQRRVLPDPVAPLAYPRHSQDVWFWLVVVGLGAGAVGVALGTRRVWLVPAAALALQVPHALVVYHGDTLEIPRHGMLVAITTRLAILLLAVLAADRLLEARRPPSAGRPV